MSGVPFTARKCEECGRVFRGKRSYDEHKPACVPVEPEPVEPCTCFSRAVAHPETGLYGIGLCNRHEGDAW